MSDSPIINTYKALIIEAKSERAKRSLEIINEICTKELKATRPNFKIAHIGNLSKAEGGPSAQAIRNATGKQYQELIKA